MPICRTRVLAGGKCTLHGKVLAHASDRVNPDAFGDGEAEMVVVVHVDDILAHAKD